MPQTGLFTIEGAGIGSPEVKQGTSKIHLRIDEGVLAELYNQKYLHALSDNESNMLAVRLPSSSSEPLANTQFELDYICFTGLNTLPLFSLSNFEETEAGQDIIGLGRMQGYLSGFMNGFGVEKIRGLVRYKITDLDTKSYTETFIGVGENSEALAFLSVIGNAQGTEFQYHLSDSSGRNAKVSSEHLFPGLKSPYEILNIPIELDVKRGMGIADLWQYTYEDGERTCFHDTPLAPRTLISTLKQILGNRYQVSEQSDFRKEIEKCVNRINSNVQNTLSI